MSDAPALRVAVGATLPPFEQEVRDKTTGELVDFSGAVSITFRSRSLVDGILVADRVASSPSLGILSSGQWPPEENAAEAFYAGWFFVDWGAGSTQETEEDVFEFYDHAPQAAPAAPAGGPCQAWITAADVECSDGVEDEKILLAARAASDILFALSARQFTGLCTNTVRPCTTPFYCGWARRYGWLPGHSAGSCACGWLSEVHLDGDPIVAVTAVKVDGVTLDPSAYRLDAGGMLVRLGDESWPACQDLAAADTEAGTWSVTYTHGMAPPAAGILAAKELACEILKAMRGEACKVPASWTRLSRQGVELSRNAKTEPAKAGTTGMPLVDLFLSSTNPHGLLRRPAVWSPDLPAARRPA